MKSDRGTILAPTRARACGLVALIALLLTLVALRPLSALRTAGGSPPAAESERGRFVALAVESVAIVVSDLDRSVAFFSDVLEFERISETEIAGSEHEHLEGVFGARARVARLRLGDEFIDLVEYLAPRGRPVPVDSRSNDRWFQHVAIIVSDMDAAYARLRAAKVEFASSGPQRLPTWNPNAGGIEAFYFKDPDGHVLEILEFPPGKGDPKWRRATERLFLGIDHTAIVVADTERSLRFYRDELGFEIAGESENHGDEQEHLNNVFGARLRITALRAPGGPGIELLEYLSPRDGRPAPADARANDLIAWQTRVVARGPIERVADALIRKVPFVSPGAVAAPAFGGGVRKAFLMRDPDAHLVKVLEEHPDRKGPSR